MSAHDALEAQNERAVIQHIMRPLDGFTSGLGLDKAATRQIVEATAADMPAREDEERMVEARLRIIEASA